MRPQEREMILYRYSDVDKRNLSWLPKDNSVATLLKISLVKGQLRGLRPFALHFKYPITAIAGANGSGKSTLLAIAACAYHNLDDGYIPSGRKHPYYRFSDFFIQSRSEIPPSGIHISYQFLYDNWSTGESGPGWQSRKKGVGGKWNNYDLRVLRNVVYFGVQRVVPHYERTTHKSYRTRFTMELLKEEHHKQICSIAGRILGKTYSAFEKHTHSKYSLPMVTSRHARYSGFNMGAGESAVFEILVALFEAGRGSLLIIDELEMGLHEHAQVKFVQELKKLCRKLHCQVICSTHSHVVLNALPPEGRFFLETGRDRTVVLNRISPSYACGMLRGSNIGELDIFVEDEVAATILLLGIPHNLRRRVTILPIGSSSAVIRGMATRYLEGKDSCICVLDGDKRNKIGTNPSLFERYTERRFRESKGELKMWIEKRLTYLPSNKTPEIWLIDSCNKIEDKSSLAKTWCVKDEDVVASWLNDALLEPTHNQFFSISKASQLTEDRVVGDLVRFLLIFKPEILDEVTQRISNSLGQ